MWQRFTERARRIVFFAQEEAGRLGENYVSTEHLLLGLLRENDTVAAKVLEAMEVSLGRIRSEIERQVTRSENRTELEMQLTPRGQRVIHLAYDEARTTNINYIGTEHLLLGLIREGEGLAGRVLAKVGVKLDRTRQEIAILQGQDGQLPGAPAQAPAKTASKFAEEWRPIEIPLLLLDEASRTCLITAQHYGAKYGDKSVTTEHLFLALMDEKKSVFSVMLEQMSLLAEELRAELEPSLKVGEPGTEFNLPFSPEVRNVLSLAYDDMRLDDRERIGTTQLLFGLLRQTGSPAMRVLIKLGIEERLRKEPDAPKNSDETSE